MRAGEVLYLLRSRLKDLNRWGASDRSLYDAMNEALGGISRFAARNDLCGEMAFEVSDVGGPSSPGRVFQTSRDVSRLISVRLLSAPGRFLSPLPTNGADDPLRWVSPGPPLWYSVSGPRAISLAPMPSSGAVSVEVGYVPDPGTVPVGDETAEIQLPQAAGPLLADWAALVLDGGTAGGRKAEELLGRDLRLVLGDRNGALLTGRGPW